LSSSWVEYTISLFSNTPPVTWTNTFNNIIFKKIKEQKKSKMREYFQNITKPQVDIMRLFGNQFFNFLSSWWNVEITNFFCCGDVFYPLINNVSFSK
jgi:hypothetical protein